LEDKPIQGLDIPVASGSGPLSSPIPRRKKSAAELNGHATNGVGATDGIQAASNGISGIKRIAKRSADEALSDDSPDSKRSKTLLKSTNGSTDDDVVLVDDSADGAIIIDDD
jgi:ubiquitin-like 1-activating enzyme E1 B